MRITGTSGSLKWREVGEQERLWCVDVTHPINEGLGEYVDIVNEEMYGEPFGIPNPDEVLFLGWFAGGEVFRSGCTFTRENGKIFYFQPGHETNPSYRNENVQRILKNAVRWACPIKKNLVIDCPYTEPVE